MVYLATNQKEGIDSPGQGRRMPVHINALFMPIKHKKRFLQLILYLGDSYFLKIPTVYQFAQADALFCSSFLMTK